MGYPNNMYTQDRGGSGERRGSPCPVNPLKSTVFFMYDDSVLSVHHSTEAERCM